MRVLGLDPSLKATGYGIVECNRGVMRLVEGGLIVTSRSSNLSQRLAELRRCLADVITSLKPEVMVVEEVFSRTAYPRTAIMMAHARGALVCEAALKNVPVFDYSATAVKRALVGNGAASKQQVASMVFQTLRLKRSEQAADVTDALALAIAYARRIVGNGLRENRPPTRSRTTTHRPDGKR
jgi:crossover junction endodeoxyribonuclease RuvC